MVCIFCFLVLKNSRNQCLWNSRRSGGFCIHGRK
nr:MAG TPA: hypothetical protein [Caudoviricetes sp.]